MRSDGAAGRGQGVRVAAEKRGEGREAKNVFATAQELPAGEGKGAIFEGVHLQRTSSRFMSWLQVMVQAARAGTERAGSDFVSPTARRALASSWCAS